MSLTSGQPAPDAETIARWWVQLNGWVWPDDLATYPKPPWGVSRKEHEFLIRGAHMVLNLFADEELVDALWRDHDARNALIHPERAT